jgi:hypothetical protein
MRSRLIWFVLLAATMAVSSPLFAQAPAGAANDLVRRVIKNEDRSSSGGPRYMYKLRSEKPERTVVKELIETNEGMVARLVSVNGKPPTAEQRAADEKKLNELVSDPEVLRERMKEQKEDEQRTRLMVKALPDAFLYEYDGTETVNGLVTTRLRFQPNPNFDPPSRETLVYRGMQGHLWVEPKQERLVRIDARLFDDVTFGWGILGRLHKGGHFLVEQSLIGENRWESTRMELDFVGKALLFKTIRIKETETVSEFRAVPANLSIAQGVELLRKSDQVVAGRAAVSPPAR